MRNLSFSGFDFLPFGKMEKRSVLIGAGSILTTAFVEEANWFIRNKNAVVPMVEPSKQTTKL